MLRVKEKISGLLTPAEWLKGPTYTPGLHETFPGDASPQQLLSFSLNLHHTSNPFHHSSSKRSFHSLYCKGYFYKHCTNVQMWELDHKECWVPKNWHFQTVVLEKILKSPMSLSELRELVMDRKAWRAAIHGVTKSRIRLSNWFDLIWSGQQGGQTS